MKTPVVFSDEIVFPGMPGELEVELETGQMLEAFWRLMGFGTLDVLLVFSNREEDEAGLDSACPIAALAEVSVELDPEQEGAVLRVHTSSRVAVNGFATWGADHASGWAGPVACATPSTPDGKGIDQAAVDGFQRRFFALLLCDPDSYGGDEFGIRRVLTDPVTEMARNAPLWKICYIAAEFLVDDNDTRREILLEDTLNSTFEELSQELDARLSHFEDRALRSSRHFSVFINEVLTEGLRDTIDGLDAARRLAGLGLVTLPAGAGDELKLLREELDRTAAMLAGLVEEIHETLEG